MKKKITTCKQILVSTGIHAGIGEADPCCPNPVRCLIDPCTIDNGGCHKDQTCTPDYCHGGCDAICTPARR